MFLGSHEEKIVCQKILEKLGLTGFQVILGLSILDTTRVFVYHSVNTPGVSENSFV